MNNIVSFIMLGYSLADPSVLPSVQVKGYYPNLIECNKHMDILYEDFISERLENIYF